MALTPRWAARWRPPLPTPKPRRTPMQPQTATTSSGAGVARLQGVAGHLGEADDGDPQADGHHGRGGDFVEGGSAQFDAEERHDGLKRLIAGTRVGKSARGGAPMSGPAAGQFRRSAPARPARRLHRRFTTGPPGHVAFAFSSLPAADSSRPRRSSRPNPSKKAQPWPLRRFPLLGKAVALAAVVIALMLALQTVSGIVAEREGRLREAERSVAASLASAQTLRRPGDRARLQREPGKRSRAKARTGRP